MIDIGRFQIYARPGSWCRPGEWCFGRQPCDEGCVVVDVAWLVITIYRGAHS